MITQTPWSMRLWMWEKNGNAGNWLVSQYIFTIFFATSALSLTWYALSIHFILLTLYLYLSRSITSCLRCYLDDGFWNYLAILTSFFCVQECIRICESNVFSPGSLILDIDWYMYNACKWHLDYQPLLWHEQVNLYLDQL